jgi:thiol:disulfide interchange protein
MQGRQPVKILTSILMASIVALTASRANSTNPDLYPDPTQAHADVSAALKMAAHTHKRVLLDFGGNWCGDCQVLDIYFHNEQNRPILDANFVLVHVNVGHYDANLPLADLYKIPLKKGVPELAVLSPGGKLLYVTEGAEFESMRKVDPSAVTAFLVKWKPSKPGCSVMMTTC